MKIVELLAKMAEIKDRLGNETLVLLIRFIDRALKSGDPEKYLQEVLKAVLSADENSEKVQYVEVETSPPDTKKKPFFKK
jgi:hypothetical protein